MKTVYDYVAGAVALAVAGICVLPCAVADTMVATSVAPGYQTHSIELGQPFGGAIAPNPNDSNILYVSYGNYGEHRVMEVALDTGTTRSVTSYIGNIGGMAVLNNGDLALTENDNFTSDTILRARDLNSDGDFLDEGEVTELIAPILTSGGNFTGAQLAVAPAGNAAQIPAGSLLVQTADGGVSSEILVIENPDTAPVYRPVNDAFYKGFTYNGGLAFTAAGHVLCGVSEFPMGLIRALVNTNGNMTIDSGESNVIVDGSVLSNSISDLAITVDDKMITSENSGTIRLFELPGDLLTGTATGSVLASTNGTYISTVKVDNRNLPFTSGPGQRATVYLGGFVTYPAATNLVAISPLSPSTVQEWDLY